MQFARMIVVWSCYLRLSRIPLSDVGMTRAAESQSRPELESIVLAGAGVGAGADKIWPTPTPARSRKLSSGSR